MVGVTVDADYLCRSLPPSRLLAKASWNGLLAVVGFPSARLVLQHGGHAAILPRRPGLRSGGVAFRRGRASKEGGRRVSEGERGQQCHRTQSTGQDKN